MSAGGRSVRSSRASRARLSPFLPLRTPAAHAGYQFLFRFSPQNRSPLLLFLIEMIYCTICGEMCNSVYCDSQNHRYGNLKIQRIWTTRAALSVALLKFSQIIKVTLKIAWLPPVFFVNSNSH